MSNVIQFPSGPSSAEKLPPTSIEKFQFHGDELGVLRIDDGDVAVPLGELCDAVGVELPGQLRKLKSAAWATMIMMITVAEDGKSRELVCLHRRSIPMWAATIHPSKVAPEARAKLIAYQHEAADVLADHFVGKRVPTGGAVLDARLGRLEDALVILIEGAAAMQQGVLDRLTAIEAAHARAPGRTTFTGTIGKEPGALIRETLRDIATARCARIVDAPTYRSARKRERSKFETRLRKYVNHSGNGASWDSLPLEKLANANTFLHDWLGDAEAQAGPTATARVRLERAGQQTIGSKPN
jgi:hypothetical protein